jgi:hypothetical protein
LGQNSQSSPDGSITIEALGGTIPYAYSWNTNPVQSTNTAENLAAGNYSITITDANGCSNVSSYTVPNLTSVVSISNIDVQLFPNPTTGIVNLQLGNTNLVNASVKVVNTNGQTVYANTLRTFANGTTSIDLSNQANGVYFVQIVSDKQVITKRIIKAKN